MSSTTTTVAKIPVFAIPDLKAAPAANVPALTALSTDAPLRALETRLGKATARGMSAWRAAVALPAGIVSWFGLPLSTIGAAGFAIAGSMEEALSALPFVAGFGATTALC